MEIKNGERFFTQADYMGIEWTPGTSYTLIPSDEFEQIKKEKSVAAENIAHLQKELAGVREELTEAQDGCTDARKARADAQKALANAQARNMEDAKALAAFQDRLSSARETIAKLEAAAPVPVSDQVKYLQEHIYKLKGDNCVLQDVIKDARNDADSWRMANKVLLAERDALKAKLDSAKLDSAKLDSCDVSKLRHEADCLREELNDVHQDYKKRLADGDELIAALRDTLDSSQKATMRLRGELAILQSLLAQKTIQKVSAEHALWEVQKKMDDAAFCDIKDKLEQAEKTIKELMTSPGSESELKATLNETRKELMEAQDQVAVLQCENNNLHEDIDHAKEQITQEQKVNSSLRDDLKDQAEDRVRCNIMKDSIAHLNEKLAEATVKIDSYKAENARLTTSIQMAVDRAVRAAKKEVVGKLYELIEEEK